MFNIKDLLTKNSTPPHQGIIYDPNNLSSIKKLIEITLDAHGHDAKSAAAEEVIAKTIGCITLSVSRGLYTYGVPRTTIEKITLFVASKTFNYNQVSYHA